MTKKISISTALWNSEEIHNESIAIFVCALGYESRSTYYAKKIASYANLKLGLLFSERHVNSFDKNKDWAIANSFTIHEYKASGFLKEWIGILENILEQDNTSVPLVVVDISSMSREMLAQVVYGLWRNKLEKKINVKFVYSLSTFSPPSTDENPVTISQPVIPEFAGWSNRPELPSAAIVGLGYEFGQAMGTLEYLEPGAAWVFTPEGVDKQFDLEVKRTNGDLDSMVKPENFATYKVNSPFECFCNLESLIYGLKESYRPMLIPFGPKIFALVCMLIAMIHSPTVAVWRVSGDQKGEPSDREASGMIVGLDISITP